MKSDSHALPLGGLNGANPLGFLAALGAFHATHVALKGASVRLSWRVSGGSWCPVLHCSHELAPDSLTELLHAHLSSRANHSALTIADNPKMPAVKFRAYAQSAVTAWQDGSDTAWAPFAAAFGSDGVADDDGVIEDTAFRTMSGAGHQHFLKFMNELARDTSAEQLHEALFGPWQYRDVGFSMRWDPEDDRRYALRWLNPSGDAARNVRGANRLAIEALPLFPTMPTTTQLVTTGFRGRKASDTFWTWPVWEHPVSIDTCRSVLAIGDLSEPNPSLEALRETGVGAVLRSRRITIGKFRNFTPAHSIGT